MRDMRVKEDYRGWGAASDNEGDPRHFKNERNLNGSLDTRTPKERVPFRSGGSVESDIKALGLRTGGEATMKAKGGKWIQKAIKHPGALHEELGVPKGKKIPQAKLEKAENSRNPKIRKQANLAETLKKMH